MERLKLQKLIDLIKHGFRVEVKVLLMAGLFSRHEISLEDDKVIDFSYVDSSETRYTLREFKTQSIVAKAAKRNNLIFEQKWANNGNRQEVQTRKGCINGWAQARYDEDLGNKKACYRNQRKHTGNRSDYIGER